MEISLNIAFLWNRFNRDLSRTARLIKEAGFDAVDFDLCTMENSNDAFNGEGYRELAIECRKQIEAEGLRVNQTHAPFHFSGWEDPDTYNNRIYPTFVRSIEISALLGAETVIVHPIHYFDYHGNEKKSFDINMEFYQSLIPYCEKFGIKVCTENMWQRDPRRKYISHDACSSKEEFVKYIDTLNSEYITACLDVGHVGLPQQDDEASDFIYALGHDRLKALHIHDNDYISDAHMVPYMGKIDWVSIGKALGEIDYTGVFTYELNGKYIDTVDDEFLPVALKYVADIARHICDIADRNRP